MEMTENDERLKRELPFDLYGRYAVVREIIHRNRKSGERFRVLDVGGRGNIMSKFLANDDVFYLDPFLDSDDENFIKGNGCEMPFEAESFDWVVSADVFEHIPDEDRGRFLEENIRVAKKGIILAAPFFTPEVARAEINANENYKAVYGGKDHIWLREHIENGLPDPEVFEDQIKETGFSFQKLHNNRLFLWQTLLGITFLIPEDFGERKEMKELVEDFNYFYNTEVPLFDFEGPSYRKIYFIKKESGLRDVEGKVVNVDDEVFLNVIRKGFEIVSLIGTKRQEEISAEAAIQAGEQYEQRISELNREIMLMRTSKFWKLREVYSRLKSVIFHPVRLAAKYERKIKELFMKSLTSLREEGAKKFLLRAVNYLRYGRGSLSFSSPSGHHTESVNLVSAAALEEIRESVRNGEEYIIIVSHDASRTGAPYVALNIAKTIRTHFKKKVITLLIQGGALEKEFGKYGLVVNLAHASLRSMSSRESAIAQSLANDLSEAGVCKYLGNTVLSGRLTPIFQEQGFFCVSLVHEQAETIKEHHFVEVTESMLLCSDSVVFPSSFVKGGFDKNFVESGKETFVRPQGIYLENLFDDEKLVARKILRKKLGLPIVAKIMLGCGFGNMRKGVDIFFRVAAEVVKANPDKPYYFVWLGEWDESLRDKLMKSAQNEGFGDRMILSGFEEDPSLFFAGSDIFLLTSRQDPFPSVVLNAMDCGVPVIAFDGAGGSPEILEKERGVIVPYLDVASMGAEISGLLIENDRYEMISKNSKLAVKEKFCFRDYVGFLLERFLSGRQQQGGTKSLRVSVVIPNYNYERYLPERLDSIINQTRRPFEIVFLDDNSQDQSIEVAENMLSESGIPYRIIRNKSNVGCFRQWARGVSEARGDLIWIAEADDSCELNFLETLVPKFIDPEVGLAYVQSLRMDAFGVKGESYLGYLEAIPGSKNRWRRDYVNSGTDEIRKYLSVKNTIVNTSAVIMRRDLLLPLGDGLGGGFEQAGDWFTYIGVLRHSKIAFSSAPLNFHRYHDGNIVSRSGSSSDGRARQLVAETLAVHRYLFSHFSLYGDQASRMFEHVELVCRNSLKRELRSFSEYQEYIRNYERTIVAVRKRILFFSTNDGWGGSEVACAKLAQKFSEEGWEVALVMSTHRPRPLILAEIMASEIHFFERDAEDYCTSARMAEFVIRFRPDIIFISQGHVFESATLMRWCKEKRFRYVNFIPLVTEYHLTTLSDKDLIGENGKFLKESEKIFLDNNQSMETLRKIFRISFDNLQVIRNGFDVPYHQEFSWNDPNEGVFRLAFLGRFERIHKGIDLLLEVLSMEKWKKRPLEVLAYGKGPFEEEMRRVMRRKGMKNLVICGYTQNLQEALFRVHGVIFPSRMEGTPISLIDALLCYRMAIVTPVGGMPEMVMDGKNGFIADSVTVSAIDECLERAWQRRFDWKELGRSAGEYVREQVAEFPQKRCIEEINNIVYGNS